MPTRSKSVWETLSTIDCSGPTEKKNGFTYLAWSWAWETLKKHYPTARFQKSPVEYLQDGTAIISVRVWIDDIEDVTEVFPVIDYKNNAIKNPNAFQINTAYQRCLVKCLAYMGLGMYIYHGQESNPDAPVFYTVQDDEGNKDTVEDLSMVANILITFIEGNDKSLDSLRQYWAINKQPIEQLENLDPDNYKRVYEAFTNKANGLKEKETN